MRWVVLAFASCIAGVSACSFFLDTDSLQGGPVVSSEGGADTGGGSDASTGESSSGDGADGGATCVSDFDCQGTNFNGCMLVKCNTTTHSCGPGEKFSGLGLNPDGDVTKVFEAEDIGYPTLLADGANFYLAAWKRDGTVSNIELRRINENAAVGGAATDLAALLPNTYEQFGSSPGMVVVGLFGGRLRLLFAGDPVGAAPMGMHEVDIDELPTFKAAPAGQQPNVDPGVVGFDANPRGPVPRLITGDWGLWVQAGKLFFFDGKSPAMPAYTAKRVLGFAPMIGLGGPYAALETSALAGPLNQATEMWASGNSASLAALVGDDTGERRGVAVAPFPESLANVVVWSYVGKSGVTMKTNLSGCIGTFCQGVGGIDNSGDVPASFPEIASGKVMGRDRDRDFAETFQVTFAQPSDPSRATTILIGSMIRVESVADAGLDAGTSKSTILNPPNFLIAAQDGPVAAAPGDVIGPSSMAVSADGKVLITWVERVMGGTSHVLRMRRYGVTTCP